MKGRDECSLKSLVAKRIFPTLDFGIFPSLPQHTGVSSPSFTSTPCAVLTKTSDWHQWDFPTMLKGKVLFVPAQRRMDRLFGRLCFCLIFQFNTARRWHLWDGIIDPDTASSVICKFPLYPRGERFHFEYGVYLLNKNIAQLRYQHGLTTPDLQQTLPNLKNFLEHGLLVRCDRHHVSSSIPVPTKSQLGVSAASDIGYPCHTSSPDRGLRKRASSEADKPKYKQTPPPSYNTAMGEEQSPDGLATPSPSTKHLSSSLDAGMASLNLAKTMEATEEGEQKEEKGESGETGVEESRRSTDREAEVEKEEETEEQPASSTVALDSSTVLDTGEETVATSQHTGAMNGSLVPEQAPVSLVPELRCSVEQAEEIMGTEATGLGLGLGMGLALGLADEARLEDYRCIPVDHAVAVECDEQVLGELDVAGFEEFSRRIYALNENMSSFRRPRKSSEK